MDIDPTIAADLGDDDACQSGVCTCGRCADSNHDLRDGSSCKADDEVSLVEISLIHCR